MPYLSIVVGFNTTPPCETAVRLASALALQAGAALHVVSVDQPVVPVGGFGWAAPYDSSAYMAELLEDRAKKGAMLAGESIECTAHAELGSPAAEIVRLAKEEQAGLIVLGAAHHTALERIFIGSTADRVVRLTPVPCLLAATDTPPRNLLVAVDDSRFGRAALHAALQYAETFGASVRCLHVADGPPPAGATIGAFDMDEYLASMTKHFEDHLAELEGRVETKIRVGDVVENVLAEADESKADMIVVGSHGRGFIGSAILGSVSEGILRRSPVSVLLVPCPEED